MASTEKSADDQNQREQLLRLLLSKTSTYNLSGDALIISSKTGDSELVF